MAAVRHNINTYIGPNTTPVGGYAARADVDGSGRIDALDLTAVRRAFLTQPAGWPPPAAGAPAGAGATSTSGATAFLRED